MFYGNDSYFNVNTLAGNISVRVKSRSGYAGEYYIAFKLKYRNGLIALSIIPNI